MTTLVEIPSCRAVHLPTPKAEPLPLSSGELVVNLIPANPPSHPSATVTITVGSSSFPLLPNTPVQKVQAVKEHASYIFAPASADGGPSIGQVKIIMKDSTSQGEWEATEALCAKFEAVLKEHDVWDEKTLFVDDEYELSGEPAKGWGETIAGAVMGVSTALADRLSTYTDKHVAHTNPTHPPPPSSALASAAASAKDSTATLATHAEVGAEKVGEAIHEGGKKLGAMLPDSIAKAAEPVDEKDKTDAWKFAESSWQQIKIAASGVATASTTVVSAVSENVHKAVEHNFGKEADNVARDIGQTNANLGATALSVGSATSAIVQGSNVATGLTSARSGQ